MVMNNTKLRKVFTLFLLYLVGWLFFTMISPEQLPIVLLVVPFIYIFATVFYTALVAQEFIFPQMKKRRIVSFILALFLVLMLVLHSLHQLTSRDLLLGAAATILLTWYVSKINAQ